MATKTKAPRKRKAPVKPPAPAKPTAPAIAPNTIEQEENQWL